MSPARPPQHSRTGIGIACMPPARPLSGTVPRAAVRTVRHSRRAERCHRTLRQYSSLTGTALGGTLGTLAHNGPPSTPGPIQPAHTVRCPALPHAQLRLEGLERAERDAGVRDDPHLLSGAPRGGKGKGNRKARHGHRNTYRTAFAYQLVPIGPRYTRATPEGRRVHPAH